MYTTTDRVDLYGLDPEMELPAGRKHGGCFTLYSYKYLRVFSFRRYEHLSNKRTCTPINFDKNFPQFHVPTFVSGDKYLSLTFEICSTRQKKAKYPIFPPNLSEKIFQLGLHATVFDPVRLFATVRLLGTRE